MSTLSLFVCANGRAPRLSVAARLLRWGCCVLTFVLATPNLPADTGTGYAYIPNAVDDPVIHQVSLLNLDGTGLLRGRAADVSNPFVPRANVPSLVFAYDPESGLEQRIHFAETMTYYHMAAYDRYLCGLGLGAATYTVPATVFNGTPLGHGLYVPFPTGYDPQARAISLAVTVDGDDSDALDGDIVVHEFAHAIQHGLLGGTPGVFVAAEVSETEQSIALVEGLADFAATSYFGDPEVGEWTAGIWHGQAFMRTVDNFHRWPDHFVPGNPYPTGMILSGALWDLRSSVGSDTTALLAWKALQSTVDNDPGSEELNTTFEDFLGKLVEADEALHDGAHVEQIRQAFAVRGIGQYDFATAFPMLRDPGNEYEGVETYTIPGAWSLAVTFDEFVTKLDDSPFRTDEQPSPGLDDKLTVDYLEILDFLGNVVGTYTGRELQGETIMIPGDSVQFHLVTDSHRAPFGYRVLEITAMPQGDTDGDGDVDLEDLFIVRNYFGITENATLEQGDTDGDGDVDLADLFAIRNNFGTVNRTSAPEPGTAVFLCVGGLALIRRRNWRTCRRT